VCRACRKEDMQQRRMYKGGSRRRTDAARRSDAARRGDPLTVVCPCPECMMKSSHIFKSDVSFIVVHQKQKYYTPTNATQSRAAAAAAVDRHDIVNVANGTHSRCHHQAH
jgi:hypothetical protein